MILRAARLWALGSSWVQYTLCSKCCGNFWPLPTSPWKPRLPTSCTPVLVDAKLEALGESLVEGLKARFVLGLLLGQELPTNRKNHSISPSFSSPMQNIKSCCHHSCKLHARAPTSPECCQAQLKCSRKKTSPSRTRSVREIFEHAEDILLQARLDVLPRIRPSLCLFAEGVFASELGKWLQTHEMMQQTIESKSAKW